MRLFSWLSLSVLLWVGWNFGVRWLLHDAPTLPVVPAAGVMAALHVVVWVFEH